MLKRPLFGILMMAVAFPAVAAEKKDARGTPAEAKAMLTKAVAYYKANGRAKALAEFNRNRPPFSDRDLYVFCIGPDKKLVADGGYREFVNQSADQLKDADGKPIGGAVWDTAMKKGEGELHYNWLNPVTKLIEPKVSYFAKVGQDACGVGSYDTK
jgi:cytochrome c